MLNVLFISPQYIKDNGLVDENVDEKFILYSIKTAMELELQELIGTDLLEEIQGEVNASTLTAANTSLLNNYIVPYLLQQVQSSLIIPLQYRLRNKGIMTFNSEEAQSADNATVSLVEKGMAHKAQFLGERLRRYLIENSSTYPLFLGGNEEVWKIRPARTAYESGFWLGNQRKPYPSNMSSVSSLSYGDYFFYDGYGCC